MMRANERHKIKDKNTQKMFQEKGNNKIIFYIHCLMQADPGCLIGGLSTEVI